MPDTDTTQGAEGLERLEQAAKRTVNTLQAIAASLDPGVSGAALIAADDLLSALSAVSRRGGGEDLEEFKKFVKAGGSSIGLHMPTDPEWYRRKIEFEDGMEIGAGTFALPPAPSPGAVTRITGERLCAAFAETFNGGGWADAPEWEDFDESAKERWRRAEDAFISRLQSAREGSHGPMFSSPDCSVQRYIPGSEPKGKSLEQFEADLKGRKDEQ